MHVSFHMCKSIISKPCISLTWGRGRVLYWCRNWLVDCMHHSNYWGRGITPPNSYLFNIINLTIETLLLTYLLYCISVQIRKLLVTSLCVLSHQIGPAWRPPVSSTWPTTLCRRGSSGCSPCRDASRRSQISPIYTEGKEGKIVTIPQFQPKLYVT